MLSFALSNQIQLQEPDKSSTIALTMESSSTSTIMKSRKSESNRRCRTLTKLILTATNREILMISWRRSRDQNSTLFSSNSFLSCSQDTRVAEEDQRVVNQEIEDKWVVHNNSLPTSPDKECHRCHLRCQASR